jgi:hypothetical protein
MLAWQLYFKDVYGGYLQKSANAGPLPENIQVQGFYRSG